MVFEIRNYFGSVIISRIVHKLLKFDGNTSSFNNLTVGGTLRLSLGSFIIPYIY